MGNHDCHLNFIWISESKLKSGSSNYYWGIFESFLPYIAKTSKTLTPSLAIIGREVKNLELLHSCRSLIKSMCNLCFCCSGAGEKGCCDLGQSPDLLIGATLSGSGLRLRSQWHTLHSTLTCSGQQPRTSGLTPAPGPDNYIAPDKTLNNTFNYLLSAPPHA